MKLTHRFIFFNLMGLVLLIGLILCGFSNATDAPHLNGQITKIQTIGCNAGANVPIPGANNLYIGRQLFNPDGTTLTRQEGCASPNALNAIQNNRWGLVLETLNWQNQSFSITKPLLATPYTVLGGPMRGAIVKAAYDPNIVNYQGKYWISFECAIANKAQFGVQGVSSCLAPYDAVHQEILKNKIYVVVSGQYAPGRKSFNGAVIPALLVYKQKLYLYWSALNTSPGGIFKSTFVRGTELVADSQGNYWARGVGHMIYVTDPNNSMEVWAPTPSDPMSNSNVHIKSIWTHDNDIVVLGASGGNGCVEPKVNTPGCFRMILKRVETPLGYHVFNQVPDLYANSLPTNPVGYVRPIKAPDGQYQFLGIFYYPYANGYSNLRIMPPPSDWPVNVKPKTGVVVTFPFLDKTLWPSL